MLHRTLFGQCWLLLVLALNSPGWGHNGALVVVLPLEGIAVDGDLSDWPEDMRRYPILGRSDGTPLEGEGDFYAAFRAAYSQRENALYVAVEVEDESIVEQHPGDTSLPWGQEGCELYLEVRHAQTSVSPLQYRIWGDSIGIWGRSYWFAEKSAAMDQEERQAPQGNLDDVEVERRWREGGYDYEWRIDVTEMTGGKIALAPDAVLGFDVALWDVDADGSETWMVWGRGKEKHLFSDRLGDMILIDRDTGLLETLVLAGDQGEINREHIRHSASYQILFTAVPFSLALLNLLLFLFYPRFKANLFYSIFTVALALFGLLRFEGILGVQVPTTRLIWLPLIVALPLGLLFMYSLFSERIPRRYWIVSALGVGLVAWVFSGPYTRVLAYYILILLFLLEVLRIIVHAVIDKKDGAGTIGLGFLALVLFIVYKVLEDHGLVSASIAYPLDWGLLVLCLSMAAYLARDAARTSKELGIQLVQVRELSEKALEQERRIRQEEIQRELLQADNRRKTEELEEARQLQLSLLPESFPENAIFDIAPLMKTATEVGGDYYDYHLSADHTLTLAVGDAIGHGLKAGNLVMLVKGLFQNLAEQPDLSHILMCISRDLHSMNLGRLNMALTLFRFDAYTLQVSSAAMPPMQLYRAATRSVEEVLLEGPPLGSSMRSSYQQRQLKLQAGDTLLIMSDGLPERLNGEQEELGYERTAELFAAVAAESPEEICASLEREGENWAQGGELLDDMTLVVLKIK